MRRGEGAWLPAAWVRLAAVLLYLPAVAVAQDAHAAIQSTRGVQHKPPLVSDDFVVGCIMIMFLMLFAFGTPRETLERGRPSPMRARPHHAVVRPHLRRQAMRSAAPPIGLDWRTEHTHGCRARRRERLGRTALVCMRPARSGCRGLRLCIENSPPFFARHGAANKPKNAR